MSRMGVFLTGFVAMAFGFLFGILTVAMLGGSLEETRARCRALGENLESLAKERDHWKATAETQSRRAESFRAEADAARSDREELLYERDDAIKVISRQGYPKDRWALPDPNDPVHLMQLAEVCLGKEDSYQRLKAEARALHADEEEHLSLDEAAWIVFNRQKFRFRWEDHRKAHPEALRESAMQSLRLELQEAIRERDELDEMLSIFRYGLRKPALSEDEQNAPIRLFQLAEVCGGNDETLARLTREAAALHADRKKMYTLDQAVWVIIDREKARITRESIKRPSPAPAATSHVRTVDGQPSADRP